MDYRVLPPEEMIETTINLPLSKSMYNRALILNALTPGAKPIEAAPPCDDAVAMLRALEAPLQSEVNIDGAGTAMRFLTAYYAATEGSDILLDGNARMRQRPIGPLVDSLRALGAEIEYAGNEGFPPLRIKGRRLKGGKIKVDTSVSSQFISAILMVAPGFEEDLEIALPGNITSLPYIQMTVGMMCHRGIDAELYANTVTVKRGTYQACADDIERDWSAASYWYAVAAMSAGWVTLPGLKTDSLQGDRETAGLFERLGVLTGENDEGETELSASPEVFSRMDVDLSETPDIVQTLAVACAMIGVPFHFTGVKSLRVKETDRLQALKNELLKISCEMEIKNDNEIKWDGKRMPILEQPVIETYGDHRMAMAFAPAAIYIPGLIINDIEVVSKSYPGFWDDMRTAGFTLLDADAPLPEPAEE